MSIADWVSIGLTLALVVITGIYVKHTSDMVKEMKNQRLGDVEMLNATRSLLNTYLAEREAGFDVWARADNDGCGSLFPEISEAGAWIRCVGRQGK